MSTIVPELSTPLFFARTSLVYLASESPPRGHGKTRAQGGDETERGEEPSSDSF